MSFLDNLENNLKTLESRDDHAAGSAAQRRERDQQRARAQASAAAAEELKHGPYTAALLKQTVRVGHEFRTKIHIAWLGTTLRLEARGSHRLELRPAANGIQGVYIENGVEQRGEPLDLKGSPEQLLRDWLTMVRSHDSYPTAENAEALLQDLE